MCVVFAGTVCDFRLSYGRVLNRRSKIIAVNRDKSQLLKNSDMFWKPTIAIEGMFSTMHSKVQISTRRGWGTQSAGQAIGPSCMYESCGMKGRRWTIMFKVKMPTKEFDNINLTARYVVPIKIPNLSTLTTPSSRARELRLAEIRKVKMYHFRWLVKTKKDFCHWVQFLHWTPYIMQYVLYVMTLGLTYPICCWFVLSQNVNICLF